MTVGENERVKTRNLQAWIDNGAKLYQKLDEQKALENDMKNKQLKSDCMSMLQMQLQWQDQDKERKKIETEIEKQQKDFEV